MDNLLIFGGTFDPIHNGHLNIAIAVQNYFNFQKFIFMPCKTPVLDKGNQPCSATHRLTMLELALSDQPERYHFAIDQREIQRETNSYTVISLQEFRQQYGAKQPITLLMGEDTFKQLPQWYQWHKLIELANILIIHRKGYNPTTVPEELQQYETTELSTLLQRSHGTIYHFNAGDYDISSTQVRKQLLAGNSPDHFVPSTVCRYIVENKLYGFKQHH